MLNCATIFDAWEESSGESRLIGMQLIMRRISIILGLTFGVALSFPDTSWAACKFDWSLGAYCGPGRTATVVGDNWRGPFMNACRTHDWCYFAGGEQIAKEIDVGYLKTYDDVNNRRSETKRQCDSYFYEELTQVCSQVQFTMKESCQNGARNYHAAAVRLGGMAFDQSIEKAKACR